MREDARRPPPSNEPGSEYFVIPYWALGEPRWLQNLGRNVLLPARDRLRNAVGGITHISRATSEAGLGAVRRGASATIRDLRAWSAPLREAAGASLGRLARENGSRSPGLLWEPLVLATFLVAGAVLAQGAPRAAAWSAPGPPPQEAERTSPVPPATAALALEPVPVAALSSGTTPESTAESSAPATSPQSVALLPMDDYGGADAAVITWWDGERWAERDARGASWRGEWLRVARTRPSRVPLELWLSILEWEPDDQRLWRAAERSAESRLRRGRRGWASARGEEYQLARLVLEAVEGAERRAEMRQRGWRGEDPDTWYRGLLNRLRRAVGP